MKRTILQVRIKELGITHRSKVDIPTPDDVSAAIGTPFTDVPR